MIWTTRILDESQKPIAFFASSQNQVFASQIRLIQNPVECGDLLIIQVSGTLGHRAACFALAVGKPCGAKRIEYPKALCKPIARNLLTRYILENRIELVLGQLGDIGSKEQSCRMLCGVQLGLAMDKPC